jgi:hypothetical protein
MPNPTIVAATKNNATIGSGVTTITVTSNGSVTAGNLMIVTILVGGATAPTAITPPGGWTTTLATTTTASGGLASAAIFTKVAPSPNASFSGAFTWTTTSTAGGEWSFEEWAGAGAALIDGSPTTSLNATSTTPPSPTITPGAGNVNDTLVCYIFEGALGATTVTIPTGMTSILTVAGTASQLGFGAASLALSSASATGANNWTFGTTQTSLGVSLLIQQGPIWGWESSGAGMSNPLVNRAPKARQRAATMRGDDGIEQVKINWQNVGFEPTLPLMSQRPLITRRYPGIKGKAEFAIFPPWQNVGFEVQPPQPPAKPARKPIGAIAPKEDGIEWPLIVWQNVGFEVQSVQPPAFRAKRAGIMPREDGIECALVNFFPMGWEVQSFQPPTPYSTRQSPFVKAGALMAGDQGNENVMAQQAMVTSGWGFDPTLPIVARNPGVRQARVAATKGRSEFAAFVLAPFTEVQSVQPPHPKPERSGAVMAGEPGIEAPFIPPIPPPTTWGFEYYLQPKVARRGMLLMTTSEDGSEFPLINWINAGWDVQPPQPPARASIAARRSGMIARSDDGNQAPFINFYPWGFEVQSVQPPHPRPEKSGSVMAGDSGIEGVLVAPPALTTWGFEYSFQPPHPRSEKSGAIMAGEPGIEAVYVLPGPPVGWGFEASLPMLRRVPPAQRYPGIKGRSEFLALTLPIFIDVQPPQPPHPRPERSGALAAGDQGNEAVFIPPPAPLTTGWGFETQSVQPSMAGRISARSQAAFGDSQFVAFSTSPWADDAQQTFFRRRLKPFDPGDSGTQAPLMAPVPVTSGWGFDPTLPMLKRTIAGRYPAIKDKAEDYPVFPAPPLSAWAFQPTILPSMARRVSTRGQGAYGESTFAILSTQPWTDDVAQTWFRVRRKTFDPGDTGIEAAFIPPSPTTSGWGFDQPQVQLSHRFIKAGALARWDDGNEQPPINFFPFGFDAQPVQPPHPRPEQHSAAIARGDDGSEYPLINFLPYGWPSVPHQPNHPRPERSAAIMAGDQGTEGVYVVPGPPVGWGFEVQSMQPPYPRPARSGAIAPRGVDASDFPLVNFYPAGFEQQSIQPPHPRPEKAGAIAAGDQGIEFTFQRIATPPFSFDFQPPLQRYRRAIDPFRDWNDPVQPFLQFLPFSFEVQPVQPPHPRPERSGALARGADGIEATQPLPIWGFEPVPIHYRKPFNRAGALARGTEATDASIPTWVYRGWELTDAPQRPRQRVYGAIQAVWTVDGAFIPPPPLTPTVFGAPDMYARRGRNPAGAMPFEQGWSLPRTVSVFYATTIVTQASGITTVTQASASTAVTAASAKTVVSGEPSGR